LVILELIPQHIGIDRRCRSETLRYARYRQPRISAGNRLKGEIADRQRHPGAFDFFEQDDFGDADAGGNLARQRQGYRRARQPHGQAVQHREHQRPPRRKRLIRRARQRNDWNVSDQASGRSSAGLQRDAVCNDFTPLGQR
jgi:hypothetical protein